GQEVTQTRDDSNVIFYQSPKKASDPPKLPAESVGKPGYPRAINNIVEPKKQLQQEDLSSFDWSSGAGVPSAPEPMPTPKRAQPVAHQPEPKPYNAEWSASGGESVPAYKEAPRTIANNLAESKEQQPEENLSNFDWASGDGVPPPPV